MGYIENASRLADTERARRGGAPVRWAFIFCETRQGIRGTGR